MHTTLTTLIAAQHRTELHAWAARERRARLARQLRDERAESLATARRPWRLRAPDTACLH